MASIVFANNELKYDQAKSVAYNEKNFIKNMAQDCKDYGYKRVDNKSTPNEILQTYPKEVSFLFFKKHINNFCYYAVSHISKYIIKDFKEQTETVLLNSISKCFSGNKKLAPKLCAKLDTKAALFDLTVLLGSFCSVNSLNIFKKVNCRFKEVGERECALYQDSVRPLDKCPFQFSNKEEVNKLYKSYFGKSCKSLRWRRPSCLK